MATEGTVDVMDGDRAAENTGAHTEGANGASVSKRTSVISTEEGKSEHERKLLTKMKKKKKRKSRTEKRSEDTAGNSIHEGRGELDSEEVKNETEHNEERTAAATTEEGSDNECLPTEVDDERKDHHQQQQQQPGLALSNPFALLTL
eukprot:CAMPEP_0184500022 /NCGR_PEP_ID=MMETSP0113_2-20130426/43367_1 /TAXON_ID=91329 /ORGANISM="Norrisiella sphaerica, Strain BC52" /LENGTH=146 /DNA_ID=CAMNT_0026888205 /DNA_START=260 /DNA_END=700 /DNA_ORIENTATION=-